jgi:hypothetical protein
MQKLRIYKSTDWTLKDHRLCRWSLTDSSVSKYNTSSSLNQVVDALPHEKYYRKDVMPQIENVTQIKLRMPEGGRPNGVKHERKKSSNEGMQVPLPESIKKREEGPAGRVHKADRLPQEIRSSPVKHKALRASHGLHRRQAGKNQAGKKRPSNRKGKRIYTDDVIIALRKVWIFFWFKCGKILAPLMRQQMAYIAQWPAFGITGEIAEMLKRISSASIDRYLKKDKQALRLKGKSFTKPMDSFKSRIPIRTFYTSEERKKPGFWQINTVHHCGQATSGQYLHTLTATDVASGWIELRSLLNNAHKWTFEALSNIKTTAILPVLKPHGFFFFAEFHFFPPKLSVFGSLFQFFIRR